MLTEGGRRRRGFGLSTASFELWKELQDLFEETEIGVKTDRWVHKKYQKEYYGLCFKKEDLRKIIETCTDKEMGAILANCKNFL